jgi:hypothetical protein
MWPWFFGRGGSEGLPGPGNTADPLLPPPNAGGITVSVDVVGGDVVSDYVIHFSRSGLCRKLDPICTKIGLELLPSFLSLFCYYHDNYV